MEKIMQFVNQIKGEKILKGAGIALIVLGVFDMLGTILLYWLFAVIPEIRSALPLPDTLLVNVINFVGPAIEILAGVLSFYFIRHREKNIFATILAMIMVLLATFTANLFPDLLSKFLTYVSLIPAYLYLFGATKMRESITYANYAEYKDFYEKHNPASQTSQDIN